MAQLRSGQWCCLVLLLSHGVWLGMADEETITLPLSMFKITKQEVGAYSEIGRRWASLPLRYPSWQTMHDMLFVPGAAATKNMYQEFKEHHPAPVQLAPYGHSGVSVATFDWLKSVLGRSPQFLVEVGSFIGNSAAVWGTCLKQQGNGAVLLCADTWDGDGNMWLDPSLAPMMKIHSGQPHIYEQFVQRMINQNLTDVVVPWRVASCVAARHLHLMRTHIDILYLDSAHELGETFMEAMLFFQTLQPGSLLAGDDWNWHAVSHDVTLFLKLHPELSIQHSPDGRTWAIKVPGTYQPPAQPQ